MHPLTWVFIGGLIVAGVLHLAAAKIQTKKQAPAPETGGFSGIARLVLTQLEHRCDALLSAYRRLDYDNRGTSIEARVRLPLNTKSRPAFGEPWGSADAELYSLSQHTALFNLEVSEVLNALGLPNHPAIPAAEDTVMVDLLAEFQEMDRYLKAKTEG